MRSFLIVAGVLAGILVSVAIAGGEKDVAGSSDLATRVELLTKELEALKPLPQQVTELQDQVRELKLRIEVLSSQPVAAPNPSGIPRNAVPREINGTTYYIIPVAEQPQSTSRRRTPASLP